MNSSPDAPFFSLVIPVYKVERFLPDALASVREQTFTDYEVLCVDDGSPDGSGALLDEAARGDGRLRVIHQRNAGVSAARNRALDRVRGTYVLFLDPDDAICPGWFAAFDAVIRRHAPDLVQFDYQYFPETTNWRTLPKPTFDLDTCTVATDDLACAKAFGPRFVEGGYPWSKAWRASLLKGKRFPVGIPLYEDRHFLWTVFPDIHILAVADFPGYFYRKNATSALAKPRPALERARITISEYRALFALDRRLRGDLRRPYPLFYYAIHAWAGLRIKLHLRRQDKPIVLPSTLPPLTRTRPAILARILFLRLLFTAETLRLFLCQVLGKVRGH